MQVYRYERYTAGKLRYKALFKKRKILLSDKISVKTPEEYGKEKLRFFINNDVCKYPDLES